jgi:glycosyltransferase involved in cell wall biosynthesis
MEPRSRAEVNLPDSTRLDGTSPSHLPTISLVVPCYSLERLQDILTLLDSVERQTHPVDELIVVVQRSQPLRSQLEARLADNAASGWRLIFLELEPQVSRARNAGVGEARSDIIAFVDDDSVLSDDWAERTCETYALRQDIIGVAGAIVPLWDSPAMAWFPRELYWMLSCTYWTSPTPVRVRNGYGANMSFRREAFGSGRRFDDSVGIEGWGTAGWRGVGGEEPELAIRVVHETGKAILYVPDIRVQHRVRSYRLASRNLVRRAYWEGRLKATLARRFRNESGVLGTEISLLKDIAAGHARRLPLVTRQPLTALKQQAAISLAIACVAAGYFAGKLSGPREKTTARGRNNE